MQERQRQEVLDDLIQVTLFDAVLIGWLRLDILQLQGEARMGFLKEKAWSLWGNEGGVSLLFFWAVASGFQDVSQDNKLGQGRSCSQVQEGQSDHWPLWLASEVYCANGREFRLSHGLSSESG